MEELMFKLRVAGLGNIPVVIGGIIPDDDAERLRKLGISRVYTPKDFKLNQIMFDIVTLADPGSGPTI
jgi:(2R)-ethylmalonyl-CoA mutase